MCDVDTGQTRLTWTVSNPTDSPVGIASDTRDVSFDPNPIPAGGESIGTEVLDGPAEAEDITLTATLELAVPEDPGSTEAGTVEPAVGPVGEVSATVTVPDCASPGPFTFTNEPSEPIAAVGDTIEYSYCGENTGDVDLEVVRIVDDRFGVLEVPEEQTVVAPGETLCNTDLELPVTYVVEPEDVGTTIVNNAVVTVQRLEDEPATFEATDSAEVEVVPTTTSSTTQRSRLRRHRRRRSTPQFPPEGGPRPSDGAAAARAAHTSPSGGGRGNPPLQAQCGLKVMLVVDRSGSIASAGATGAVKSA